LLSFLFFPFDLAISYIVWASAFVSRTAEHEDIGHGIAQLYALKRERTDEKARLKADLERARRELPACIAILRSFTEASNVSEMQLPSYKCVNTNNIHNLVITH
jgi:hypothetical protein